MQSRILSWLIQAAIVGIGYEVGKDLYYWAKGRKQEPSDQNKEQPPPQDDSDADPPD